MGVEVWIITLLTGLLINIVTGSITYILTTRRDRARFESESRQANARIAEIAVHHLYGSYLANRRLRLDVLSHIGTLRRGDLKLEVFSTILDGIARSLEQERISLIPNINTWKGFLDQNSESFNILLKLQREDFLVEVPRETVIKKQPSRPQLKADPEPEHPRVSLLGSLAKLAKKPQEELLRAVAAGDPQRLRELARGDTSMFSAEEKIILGSALSLTGDIAATDLLSSAYAEAADALDGPALHVIVGGLVQVAERNDTESQTIEIVQPMVEELVRRDGTGAEDKAWLLNQLQKLYWGANQPSRCIEVLEEVIQLQPEEPSYHHNLALCYNALGNPAQAAVAIQRALDLDTRDPDHLSVAIRVFRAVGEVEKADRLMESLQKIDPFEAMMAESVDINEVAKTLGIEDDPHKMEELRKAFEGEGDATW